ncbi:MbtH family NRPS accessory protein [Nonomuraea sp. NPDC050643]|uniref:MbtH family NRPS accessory protein n=1 Tax=Nonomuraea sp. NPDC050643 TaxID=3155660 RepID=UPI0033CC3DF3
MTWTSVYDDPTSVFAVVRNQQGRNSIWPAGRAMPDGWEWAGFTGAKADCLAWIGSADVDGGR